MSIELLDKTRKMNRLLNEHHSSKVAFDDLCEVLGQMLSTDTFVFSRKGKVLGLFYIEKNRGKEDAYHLEKGEYIDGKLNERFMNVLSTKENVNLETFGFPKNDVADVKALITPIRIGGVHLGTLVLCRREEEFSIEDIIISEYSTTVVGLEMMWSVQQESDREENDKKNFSSAVAALTSLEQRAVSCVFFELDGREGTLVTSKLAKEIGITRTVIVNALRKLESAGLIKTKSSGVKGTHIRILNGMVYDEFVAYYKEKWNSMTQK